MLFNPQLGGLECYTFPKGIFPKVNVIARLELELAHYDFPVRSFNHYTTGTPSTGNLITQINKTGILTKRMEIKLVENHARMLQQKLYGTYPSISQNIQVRSRILTEQCCWNRDDRIGYVL